MYASCPLCNHSEQISRKQLKKNNGKVTCSRCQLQFNAQNSLSKKPHQNQIPERLAPEAHIPEITTLIKARDQVIKETETIKDSLLELYDWQKTRQSSRPSLWLVGTLFGICLLMYQIYYFTGYSISQNPQIRPWLNTLCSPVNCSLPDYRKPLEFTTIGSSFDKIDNQHYRLRASFINHADLSQALPYLQLRLQNIHGGVFAQRLFSPKDYLNTPKPPAVIASTASLDIDLMLAIPAIDVAGYTIELK